MKLIDQCKLLELFEGLDLTGMVEPDIELLDLRKENWSADANDIIVYTTKEGLSFALSVSPVIKNQATGHILMMLSLAGVKTLAIFDSTFWLPDINMVLIPTDR
jgi:hypothetical protein